MLKLSLLNHYPNFTNSTTESYHIDSASYQKQRDFAATYAYYWSNVITKHGPFSLVFLNSMVLCDLIEPTKEQGCKVIQAVRETAQVGAAFDVMKKMFSNADAVMFISEYDQDLFGNDFARSIVIQDAVDPQSV